LLAAKGFSSCGAPLRKKRAIRKCKGGKRKGGDDFTRFSPVGGVPSTLFISMKRKAGKGRERRGNFLPAMKERKEEKGRKILL